MTVVDKSYFDRFKRDAWIRLWSDVYIGYIDHDILDLLIRFNMDKNIYTKSSCSGRIVVSDSRYPWSREETGIVFKKHGPVSVEDIRDIIERPVIRNMWLNVSGPIIHLSTLNMRYARLVLRIAREAGFKHSGVLSVNKFKGIIVEIVSGVKMSHLLKTPSRLIVDKDSLPSLVEEANKVYERGAFLLERLKRIVFTKIPIEEDEEIVNDDRVKQYRSS